MRDLRFEIDFLIEYMGEKRNGRVEKGIVRSERNSDGISNWLLAKAIAPPKSGAGWVNGGVTTVTLALVNCYYPTAAFLLSMTNRFAAEGCRELN